MILLWTKYQLGEGQYIYCYQLRHPSLRRGFALADYCWTMQGGRDCE